MTKKAPKGRVQSLSRGLKLLEAVVTAGGGLSNAEADGVLPVERSSTYRLLQTLVAEGFLRQDRQTKRFFSGPKVLRLASQVIQSSRLSQACYPYLEELTRLTGETSHCATLCGAQVLLSEHVLSPHAVGVTSTSPRMEPVYCTALGKALVADLSDPQLRTLLEVSRFKAFTPNTITSWRGFLRELERVRKEGIAVDDEEYSSGVRCVAAPVRDFSGRCVGAIGISGLRARLTKKQMAISSRHVKTVAAKLCRDLGYLPK